MNYVLIFVVGIAAVSADKWEDYVNNQLVGAGMKSGAILGRSGTVWAKNNVEPTTEETKKIIEQLNNRADFLRSGIKFGGVKYLKDLLGNPESLRGSKGAEGIIIAKTNQVVIVGTYDKSLNQGTAANIVQKLGAYLKRNGY